MRANISVIGSGHVGATTALYLAQKEVGDVKIFDILEGLPEGISLDIFESSPAMQFDAKITGTTDYSGLKGSDIIVVTAGLPRKPNMDRLDLLKVNGDIVKSISDNINKYAKDAIVIVVSNPVDIMSYLTYKKLNLPRNKVIGMAGALDSSRLESFIAMELNISVKSVSAMILGGHGDQMIPLPRYTTVRGIPITEFLDKETIDRINKRAQNGGAEIVSLLKKGSAYYAPAGAVCNMVSSIVREQNNIFLSSCILDGEYGISGCSLGVPAVLGKNGIEKIIELDLNESELGLLRKNASVYKESIASLKSLDGFGFL